MNCLIVDDEPLAVDVIVSYVEQVGDINIVETTNNPLEVIRILKQHQIDLVFLDIEMPNLNGIDLVKTLDHLPQFIFRRLLSFSINFKSRFGRHDGTAEPCYRLSLAAGEG